MALPHGGATIASSASVSYDDVLAAAQRLRGVAHQTPVLRSQTLDRLCGASVFVKCENLQRVGAFKFRGAYNFLASLSDAERSRGVVAFSSGNHAQGVALAARLFGVPATIVMPTDAPAAKLAATRDYGAEIVTYERENLDRESIAERIARERGATVIPPFDDARIVAGAGTAALELLEEVEGLEAIVVPLGGGGLMSGTALAAHGVDPKIAIYGVEPDAGNDFAQSLEQGRRVAVPLPQTIADGLQTTSPGEITFAVAREHVRAVATVSDDELRAAMRMLFERMKIVVEPSGGAALAALLARRIPELTGRRVGAIISGGNVDPERFAALLAP